MEECGLRYPEGVLSGSGEHPVEPAFAKIWVLLPHNFHKLNCMAFILNKRLKIVISLVLATQNDRNVENREL